MLTIASAKLTGAPAAPGWAQVYDFAPEDLGKLEKRGHLFAVIATSRVAEGIDKVVAGREILTRLHEEYFGKEEGTSFNVLKSAIEKVIKEFDSTWGDVEIAAVAQLKDIVYSAAGGGSQIAILRNGMFAKILVSQKGRVTSASGYPKENDVILLGTRGFFEGLSDLNLKEALENPNPGDSFEILNPLIQTKEEKGNIGAMILKFAEEKSFFATQTSPTLVKKQIFSKINIKFLEKFKDLPSRFFSFVSKKLPPRKIFVKQSFQEELPEKKKTTLSVGAVLLILLLVSIGFGLRQKKIKEGKEKYMARLKEAIVKIDESITLKETDKEKSRSLFREGFVLSETLKSEGVKDTLLDELFSKIEKEKGGILAEYKTEPGLFMDLSLLSSGFSGDSLSFSLGKLYILDKNSKKIVGINIDTKKTEVVAGPDKIGGTLAFTSYEDLTYILTEDGIYQVGKEKKKVIEKDWKEDVFIRAYAGNLYILDKKENQMLRYPGTQGSFSTKQKWLAPGVSVDFSLVKSIAIDGSIWVMTSSGKILRLSTGSPANFSTQGVFPDLANMDLLYTNEDLESVYILDKSLKRILVFGKDNKFKAQYYSDIVSETKDFIVSEKEKKMILLTGDKLLFLEIKHL